MSKQTQFSENILDVCAKFSEKGLNDYKINEELGNAFALGIVMPLTGNDCFVTKQSAEKVIKAWARGLEATALNLYAYKVNKIKKGK